MSDEGIEVSENIVAKAVANIRSHDRFVYLRLQSELIECGCHPSAAYRAADRVLQRLRKQGQIAFRKQAWEWIQ